MALTKKRSLRSGAPVWTSYPHHPLTAKNLSHDFQVDALVVGSGISGALTAHALAKSGRKVAIVDRRPPVTGSTPASTALLQFEIDVPLISLKQKIGARNAERAWLRSKAALDSLRALIDEEKIDAAVTVRPSVYLAGNELNASDLQHETRARQRIGLPSDYLSRAGLKQRFSLERAAAIVSAGNLTADPHALTNAVLRRAEALGARLFSPCEVLEIAPGKRSVLVLTAEGYQIEARQLVLCCGYEMPKIVPAAGHKISSTWAIATRAQPKRLWPERCLIWEASDPYLYARTTEDGRVICGGEDEEFADVEKRDDAIAKKTAAIEKKLGVLLPEIDPRAVFRWTGSFGQTPTGLPSIGAIPGQPRCYAVLGYGGNGITFSMLAAELITGAIQKKPDPDARLFAFR